MGIVDERTHPSSGGRRLRRYRGRVRPVRLARCRGFREVGTAVPTLAEAAEFVLKWLANPTIQGLDLLAGVTATVHRIVHGGERFRTTAELNEPEFEALAELGSLAPLHNPPALAVITTVRRRLGPGVPIIGVFDTAYYAALPEAAIRYAVPPRWRADYGIRRYGFHGMAHRYLCESARARLCTARATSRIVSLQLGRGCSVTATLDGRAIATSMGFTPLEGLVMGTRAGDVDPGAILHVMERSGMSPADMRRELNEQGGLRGLSGKTADMRELLALEQEGRCGGCACARGFLSACEALCGCVPGRARWCGCDRVRRRYRRELSGRSAPHRRVLGMGRYSVAA